MVNVCPNCGKPIRASTKFCGFCGFVISHDDLGIPKPQHIMQAGRKPPRLQPKSDLSHEGKPCTHCGKRNRVGVKFCTSCGNQISQVTAPLTPPTSVRKPPRKRSRITTLSFLIGGFIIICGALLVIAYGLGYFENVFPTEIPISTIGVAEAHTVTATAATPIPSPTPEPTKTEIPTKTISPTETSLPTFTSTPAPKVVFRDDFLEGLINWLPLGEEPGSIGDDIFPPDLILGEFLNLKGHNFDEVGVTSIQTITLVSGMIIDFDADVEDILVAPLYFDWTPGEKARSPDELGPIYLEIFNSEVRFHYQKNSTEVDYQLTTHQEGMRTYRIVFGPDWEVVIYVGDGEFEELFRASIDEPDPLFGRITFSGYGLINRITITLPSE